MISVIIPAYNEEKYIEKAIRSIQKAALKITTPVEIIVVDNDSTDNTVKLASQLGGNVISCSIRNISAVCNAGFNVAAGEIVCRMDADSTMEEKLLEEMQEVMKTKKFIGGGSHVKMVSPRWWVHLAAFLIQSYLRIRGMSFGVFFMSKKTFEDLGGYDEKLLVAEDGELSLRLLRLADLKKLKYAHLKSSMVTVDRKLHLGFWGHLKMYFNIIFLPKVRSNKEKLSYWYKVNR